MNTDDIDWIFDASREGGIPNGGIWRWVIKRWALGLILAGLAAVAAAIALFMCPKDIPLELVFSVVMAVMIILFCCFLVWMTYRCGVRRNRERMAERKRF